MSLGVPPTSIIYESVILTRFSLPSQFKLRKKNPFLISISTGVEMVAGHSSRWKAIL